MKILQEEKYTIAIDGHSSCGKSTLAKDLAKALKYIYIDSGAMYRATTLFFIWQNINIKNSKEVTAALSKINIEFRNIRNKNNCFLNGENVSEEIRDTEVSQLVSHVAAVSEVRRKMVALQRAYGKQKGIVMDGRDIGTVVFPNAEIKLFVTAEIETRSHRRFQELKSRNMRLNYDQVKTNLIERDHIDSTRADSPLKQATDAILLDNTNLSPAEQLQSVLEIINQR